VTDLETRIAAAMRARAEASSPAGELRRRVHDRAGHVRRRRRIAGALAGAAAVVAVSAGLTTVPTHMFTVDGRGAVPAVPREPVVPDRSTDPTTLPALTTLPGAAADPAAVGTDPRVLHFDVYLDRIGATASDWTSAPGYERFVTPYDPSGRAIEVLIGRDPAVLEDRRARPGWNVRTRDGGRGTTETTVAPIRIGDRPATLHREIGPGELAGNQELRGVVQGSGVGWIVRWQPVDGLYAVAQVVGATEADRETVLTVAGALRLDQAQRCATPLRLATVPVGAVLSSCQTSVVPVPVATTGAWRLSALEFTRADRSVATLWTEVKPQRAQHDLNQFQATHTINGARAQWRAADPRGLWLLEYGPAEVFVSGTTEAEAVALVQGLTFAPDLADVGTWVG
jgi:phage terminase large subunit-like protein